MKIGIYGLGGFGRELIAVAGSQADVCFLSDSEDEIGVDVLGLRTYSLGQFAEAEGGNDPSVIIAVADAAVRRKLADKVAAAGLRAGQVIAGNSVVGPGVDLGEGAILCHHTTITASARIGRHFHANIYSYVAHDCVIGDFVTLAPRACINGNTVVEDDAYIGTGAILKQGTPDKPLRIGRGAVVGMGAVVTKDVPAGAVVVGNPARPLERT